MRSWLAFGLLIVLSGCGHPPAPTVSHGRPVSEWVHALQDPDPQVRKKAVTALGNVGPADAAVIPALAGALKDPDLAVRREAILALLKIGPPARDAIPALIEAKRDSDPKVRDYAARALERIQGKS